MAKIVKSSLQLEALKEVNENLKLLKKIDEIDSNNSTITIKSGKIKIVMDDASFAKKVIHTLKRDTLHSINKKCSKFSIELDDEDKKILGILEKEIDKEESELEDKEQEVLVSQEQEEVLEAEADDEKDASWSGNIDFEIKSETAEEKIELDEDDDTAVF